MTEDPEPSRISGIDADDFAGLADFARLAALMTKLRSSRSPQIPDTQRPVLGAADHDLIVDETDAPHSSHVPLEPGDFSTLFKVPDPHRPIRRAGSEQSPIRRERTIQDCPFMSLQDPILRRLYQVRKERPSAAKPREIPDPNRAVIRPGHQMRRVQWAA